jgi:hypothetical protein
MEELARKIDRGAVTVACVRRICALPLPVFTSLFAFATYSLLWGISAGFLGAYTIILDLNLPLIIQPQLFGFLALVSWGQVRLYP